MARARSLKSQFNYAITQSTKIGTSKRGDRMDPACDNNKYIYSIERAEQLRATAKDFSNFMNENYKSIKMLKDIKPEHLQHFFDSKAEKWTEATATEKRSQFSKLNYLISSVYDKSGIKRDSFTKDTKAHGERIDKSRTKTMQKEHLQLLRIELQESKGGAKIAVELASREGLRAKECARLKFENIDLKNKMIHIRDGGKGGKYRDIPIREKDIEFFKELKRGQDPQAYVCGNIKEDSLNKGIRRALKNLNLDKEYNNTTVHSIRKLYAQERMQEITGTTEREDPKTSTKERKAWEIVQKELGHGEQYRTALYNTYCR